MHGNCRPRTANAQAPTILLAWLFRALFLLLGLRKTGWLTTQNVPYKDKEALLAFLGWARRGLTCYDMQRGETKENKWTWRACRKKNRAMTIAGKNGRWGTEGREYFLILVSTIYNTCCNGNKIWLHHEMQQQQHLWAIKRMHAPFTDYIKSKAPPAPPPKPSALHGELTTLSRT